MKTTFAQCGIAHIIFIRSRWLFLLIALPAFCVWAATPAPQAAKQAPKVITTQQTPMIIHAKLSPAAINSNGVSQSLVCIYYDESDVIRTGDGNYIEVDHCDSDKSGTDSPGSGGSGLGGATPTEDCELFTSQLTRACAPFQATLGTECQYDACTRGAQCEKGQVSQCGPKPKSMPSKAQWTECFDEFAANINYCTGPTLSTIAGQNGCLYGAASQLQVCVSTKQKIAPPASPADRTR